MIDQARERFASEPRVQRARPGEPHRARAGRARGRRLLQRRVPLDQGPRRAVRAPPRGAQARRAAGGPVRRQGQHRRLPAPGGRGGRRAALRRAHERVRGPLELRGARRDRGAAAPRRLRRRALLARALAGEPRRAARVREHRVPRQPPGGAPRGAARAVRGGGGPPLRRAAPARLRAPEHHRPRAADASFCAAFGYCSVCGRGIVDRTVGESACPERGSSSSRPCPRSPSQLSLPAAAGAWAPAATATIHPGVQTFTAGGQCTANFIYTDSARHLHRPGRALRQHRCGHRHRRLPGGHAAARHPGRGHRRQPARHARLQLLGDDAGERRERPRHLRLQRPGAREDRSGRRGQGQPVGARLRRADRRGRRLGHAATTSTRTATRRCASASPS